MIMLKVENLKKVYKLGQIGGTTLRDELHRRFAKIVKKEDPTRVIGTKSYKTNELFTALDNVSFEIKKGERVGIIGHNGAGKSTLLKLISRITAPTEGTIYLNGRVASMLEVGTGFHPELTGRENIYMNGAILGMTKKEIDKKIDDIIGFSEVEKFIDTPVKRYSSGMYVKLAFSVAAHLDSEIMIMDEVLAVGDASFQNKCLEKMKAVSLEENKTILYVSHNMSTIKKLCNRCIVLNHGRLIFDGSVDEAIAIYTNNSFDDRTKKELVSVERLPGLEKIIHEVELLDTKDVLFKQGEDIKIQFKMLSKIHIQNLSLRIVVNNADGTHIGMSFLNKQIELLPCKDNIISFVMDTSLFPVGKYSCDVYLTDLSKNELYNYDVVAGVFCFEITQSFKGNGVKWYQNAWGNTCLPDLIQIE